MSTKTTRRELLKGMGLGVGATLLTPILSQLAAHAAGDEQAANRLRVVFVMQSNGMNPIHLRPREGLAMTLDLETAAKERGIKYFLVSYTDLFGTQRAKLVPGVW